MAIGKLIELGAGWAIRVNQPKLAHASLLVAAQLLPPIVCRSACRQYLDHKVEGRQRSPTYVAQVTRNLRQALDAAFAAPEKFSVKPAWAAELGKVAEGSQITLGAYNRPWR